MLEAGNVLALDKRLMRSYSSFFWAAYYNQEKWVQRGLHGHITLARSTVSVWNMTWASNAYYITGEEVERFASYTVGHLVVLTIAIRRKS